MQVQMVYHSTVVLDFLFLYDAERKKIADAFYSNIKRDEEDQGISTRVQCMPECDWRK